MTRICAFVYILLLAGILNSCKKTTSAPSIIGTWTVSNISGSYGSQNASGGTISPVTYSYSSPVLTETDTTHKALITVNEEAWTFNYNGTFSIAESYKADTATAAVIDNINGWWDYTGSTIPNSTIVLRSIVTPSILPIGGSFFIQSVSKTQLVLTAVESNSTTTGTSYNRNLTVTFTRQ